MFTGLVEGRGLVHDVRPDCASQNQTGDPAVGSDSSALRLTIRAPDGFTNGQLGESVAINGCCLTAIAIKDNLWSFQAGAETLSKTNLGRLRPSNAVNLERALPVGGRLGGHFVQGHVDAVGHVERSEHDGAWVTMWFRVPASLSPEIVSKGSIAIDGVSLTVVQIDADRFSVALIPHTLEQTTLGLRRPGDAVNVETDILGKYVRKLMRE
jgi:riboflavin synthase